MTHEPTTYDFEREAARICDDALAPRTNGVTDQAAHEWVQTILREAFAAGLLAASSPAEAPTTEDHELIDVRHCPRCGETHQLPAWRLRQPSSLNARIAGHEPVRIGGWTHHMVCPTFQEPILHGFLHGFEMEFPDVKVEIVPAGSPAEAPTKDEKPHPSGHFDPDCEVRRGVGWMCTCETEEAKAETRRERAECEAERDALLAASSPAEAPTTCPHCHLPAIVPDVCTPAVNAVIEAGIARDGALFESGRQHGLLFPAEATPGGDEWLPTAAHINALPDPVRRYIHDLETRCDPAGELRELVLVRDENAQLRATIALLTGGHHPLS